MLLKAAPAILQKFPDAIFLLVGADLTNSRLPNLIRNSDVTSHFRLLGFRADAIRCISAMDIVVQPSLSEGLPRTLLEAMSLGKPVVASRVGGIPEIIDDDGNGCLIPPNDPNALAQKTIDLLSDASRRKALGDHGFQTINDKFQIDRMIGEFDNLYSSPNWDSSLRFV
ncbi:MAG TPA: glycosyltransferase family 4 protein [Acidobacteriota bacterium]|nr:glycosyltransferase family 4 protein [Acidobacteriota bacterium]